MLVFQASALDQLLRALGRRGFRLVGPVARAAAIVHDDIASAADLPAGMADDQAPGHVIAELPELWPGLIVRSTSTSGRPRLVISGHRRATSGGSHGAAG